MNQKIILTWKGWTTLDNASIYEAMLNNEVFLKVKRKGIEGLEKVSISTMKKKDEMEFLLVLQFDSLESIKMFTGKNYEEAYIPENAKLILSRFDNTAQHFTLKKELILKQNYCTNGIIKNHPEIQSGFLISG